MHIVGLFGLLAVNTQYFANLTSLNLLVCFTAIIPFYTSKVRHLVSFFTLAFTFGMFIEIIGVNTGFPFGKYYYTEKLGFSFMDVPLIIGVNWFILSYGVVAFFNTFFTKMNFLFKSILAALLMTGLDALIEPFAIRYSLWIWESLTVPVSNYFAWFFISLFLFLLGFKILKYEKNIVAISSLFIFLFFFVVNNLLA